MGRGSPMLVVVLEVARVRRDLAVVMISYYLQMSFCVYMGTGLARPKRDLASTDLRSRVTAG